MVTCPISFVTTPPPCILEKLKAILKYLEVSEQSYRTVRCICFLRLDHSSSCHYALSLFLMQLSVCTCHRSPPHDWLKSLFLFCAPVNVLPLSQHSVRRHLLVYLLSHIVSSLSAGTSTQLMRTVYGENVIHKRFKAKMPFYKEKYNRKCIRYSSLLGSSVLTLEQGITFLGVKYRKLPFYSHFFHFNLLFWSTSDMLKLEWHSLRQQFGYVEKENVLKLFVPKLIKLNQ